MQIGHRKAIRKLTFRALHLRFNEGLTLETPVFESFYGGHWILIINSVEKTKFSYNTPHRRSTSFFTNLPSLFDWRLHPPEEILSKSKIRILCVVMEGFADNSPRFSLKL